MDDVKDNLTAVKRELSERERRLQTVERNMADLEHRLESMNSGSGAIRMSFGSSAARFAVLDKYRQRLSESLRKMLLRRDRCREEVLKALERKHMLEDELLCLDEEMSAECAAKEE